VHERDAHKQTVDLHALEQICTRIDHENSIDLLDEYERVCHSMLTKVIESRLKKTGNFARHSDDAQSNDIQECAEQKVDMNADETICICGRNEKL
jgi:hypothetical protein